MQFFQLAIALCMASTSLAWFTCVADEFYGGCQGFGPDAGSVYSCSPRHPCPKHKKDWKCNPVGDGDWGAWC
ncbi:unnamed protein product [Zymoseptoria tritici ST99CH_1E4]|uniref:CBM1 domain-containing protein n=1 Tax=Zymoseptoria tritici ST99CH_1E4 TaxID=1276532 RepID=A0A2H1G4K8_ZYMTR|nr:unnamed protein product [Zymoseptoria tritici ST99CH_1E4]